MYHRKRPIMWTSAIVLVLLMLLAAQWSNEVQWNQALVFIVIVLAIIGVYEIWHLLKTRDRTYRIAFAIGLRGALMILWVNGAVGIIGSEDNPANLLYGAVLAVGLIGALMSHFQPRGMAYTLLLAAVIHILVPFFALFIWPAQTSRGEAGVLRVIVFNTLFGCVFILSAWLFWRASKYPNKKEEKK